MFILDGVFATNNDVSSSDVDVRQLFRWPFLHLQTSHIKLVSLSVRYWPKLIAAWKPWVPWHAVLKLMQSSTQISFKVFIQFHHMAVAAKGTPRRSAAPSPWVCSTDQALVAGDQIQQQVPQAAGEVGPQAWLLVWIIDGWWWWLFTDEWWLMIV